MRELIVPLLILPQKQRCSSPKRQIILQKFLRPFADEKHKMQEHFSPAISSLAPGSAGKSRRANKRLDLDCKAEF